MHHHRYVLSSLKHAGDTYNRAGKSIKNYCENRLAGFRFLDPENPDDILLWEKAEWQSKNPGDKFAFHTVPSKRYDAQFLLSNHVCKVLYVTKGTSNVSKVLGRKGAIITIHW